MDWGRHWGKTKGQALGKDKGEGTWARHLGQAVGTIGKLKSRTPGQGPIGQLKGRVPGQGTKGQGTWTRYYKASQGKGI